MCYLYIPGGEEATLVVHGREAHVLTEVEVVVSQPRLVPARRAQPPLKVGVEKLPTRIPPLHNILLQTVSSGQYALSRPYVTDMLSCCSLTSQKKYPPSPTRPV